jgi:hypothetical protein
VEVNAEVNPARGGRVVWLALSDAAVVDLLYDVDVGECEEVMGQLVERPEWLVWRVNDGPKMKLLRAVSELMRVSGYHAI